jgi:hypothetical protein
MKKRRVFLGWAGVCFTGVALALALFFNSCGGKWDDDQKNWRRAFNGQIPPPDVKVLHSRYYRSPHFTYEAYYYFQITASDQFLQSWVKHQNLALTNATSSDLALFYDKPAWFLPRPIQSYEMWRPFTDEFSRFRIFRDTASKDLFVTDSE